LTAFGRIALLALNCDPMMAQLDAFLAGGDRERFPLRQYDPSGARQAIGVSADRSLARFPAFLLDAGDP
jgi:hypothetical protein